MRYEEIKGKSLGELYQSLYDISKELVGLRLQQSMQQLKNTAAVKQKRRDAARIRTALNVVKSKGRE